MSESTTYIQIYLLLLIPYYLLLFGVGILGWAKKLLEKSKKSLKVCMCDCWTLLYIYFTPLITGSDMLSDVVMVIEMSEDPDAAGVMNLAIAILIFHATVSCVFTFWIHRRISYAILQFFMVKVFWDVFQSMYFGRQQYELHEQKLWETAFESFPELLLQLYYILAFGSVNYFIYFSIFLSIASITKTINYYDSFGVDNSLDQYVYYLYFFLVGMLRFCEVLIRVIMIAAASYMLNANAIFLYVVFVMMVSIGLQFYFDKKNTVLDSILDGLLNAFCINVYIQRKSCRYMNWLKVYETACFVIYCAAVMGGDVPPVLFYIMFAALGVSIPLYTVVFLHAFNKEEYKLARDKNVKRLMENEKIELIVALLQRREISPDKRLLNPLLEFGVTGAQFARLGFSGKVLFEGNILTAEDLAYHLNQNHLDPDFELIPYLRRNHTMNELMDMGFDRYALFEAGVINLDDFLAFLNRKVVLPTEEMVDKLLLEGISKRELIDAGFRKDWVSNASANASYSQIRSERQLNRLKKMNIERAKRRGYDLEALQRVYEEDGPMEYDPEKYKKKIWKSNSYRWKNTKKRGVPMPDRSKSVHNFPDHSDVVE